MLLRLAPIGGEMGLFAEVKAAIDGASRLGVQLRQQLLGEGLEARVATEGLEIQF